MAITNNINLLDKSVVTQIISEMEKSEDKDRRRHAFNSWQVYSGNSYEFVKNELARTRPKSFEAYTIPSLSVSKMIVDKLAKAYKEEPLRKVSDDESNLKSERLHDIYEQAMGQRQLQFFDTTANLHKYGLMWVTHRDHEDGGNYQFWALQPHEFAVIRNKDTGELECVILQYGDSTITSDSRGNSDGINDLIAEDQHDSGANTRMYAMWTKEHHVNIMMEERMIATAEGNVLKTAITYVENPDNPNNVNVLGLIPFVFLSYETQIDYPTQSPLMEQTVTSNALMAEYLTASNVQGTGTLVFSYPEKMEGMFKKITRGLMASIKLPQSSNPDDRDTSVDYINPSPDLAGMREAVMTYIKSVFKEHGIEAGSITGSDAESFSSGLDRAIANAGVQDIVEKHQHLYRGVEEKMFEIIKAWESFLGGSVFSDDDKVSVIYPKPKVMMSDRESLENVKMLLDMKLIDRAGALMKLDPNLSPDEAQEKLDAIDEKSMVNVARMLNGNTEEDNEDTES